MAKKIFYNNEDEEIIMKAKITNKKNFNFWFPKHGSSFYFNSASDYDFKAKHPVGYVFLVILGLFVLLGPVVLFSIYACSKNSNENLWLIPGYIGAFIFGIGLFNFVAIIIEQYLGHLVTMCSLIIGVLLMAISL